MSLKFTSKNTLKRIFTRLSEIFVKKTDIQDNLTSTDTDKPLSARMGVKLNGYVNNICSSLTDVAYPTDGGGGWYRIAKYDCSSDGNVNAVIGASCGSCEIIIKRAYSNTNNEFHHIRFVNIYNKSKFEPVLNMSNERLVQTIRHTVDKTNKIGYIEIYVGLSPKNVYWIGVTNNKDTDKKWEVCTWERTETTVDNVTVLSSMNIEANTNKFDTKPDKISVNVASGATVSTGIPVNAGSYGKTYLVMASGNSNTGNASVSEIGMIRCGYDGNNYTYTKIAFDGGSSTSSAFLLFSVTDGILQVSANFAVTMRVTFIAN